MTEFDTKRFSGLDWTVLVTAGIALISLFLPWYGVSVLGFNASVSGWSTGYGWLAALALVAAGVYLGLAKGGDALKNVSVPPALIVLILASVGTVLILIRWATLPSGSITSAGGSFSYGPRFGIFLALIAGLVQAGVSIAMYRTARAEAGPQAS